MANHEFGIMQTPPKNRKRYDDFEPEKYNCITVNDDYLEIVANDLNDIDFYWHTLDVSGKGLAYCGVTLIPHSSMQKFISVIKDISELNELKKILLKAYEENKWVIHFGI